MNKRAVVAIPLLAAALGAVIVFAATAAHGEDPAATLAAALGLGSGPIVGALLGLVLGAWLVLGGERRVAATTGFFLGVAGLAFAWRFGRGYLWVVDVVMNAVFGEGGSQYSGLALFLVAIPLLRTIASVGEAATRRLLKRTPG